MADAAPPRVATWLGARRSLELIGILLTVIVGASTVTSWVFSLGTHLAESRFLTVEAADKREEGQRRWSEERIAAERALAAEREARIVQGLQELRQSSQESGARMQASLDRISNFLMQGRR